MDYVSKDRYCFVLIGVLTLQSYSYRSLVDLQWSLPPGTSLYIHNHYLAQNGNVGIGAESHVHIRSLDGLFYCSILYSSIVQ